MANEYGDYGKVTWGSKATREGDVWYVVDQPDGHMLYTSEDEAKRIAQQINYGNPTTGKDWGGRPAPKSYADEMQYALDDYWNGTPEELQARNQAQGQGLYLDLLNEQSGGLVDYRSQAPVIPPEPGALAEASRRDAGIREQQSGYVNDFIARNNSSVDSLESAYNALNASDQSLYSDYKSALSGIQFDPLALAASNPQDIARQEQAYGTLMGAANGSMDAFSNPQDVARQEQVFGMLMGAAGGSLDAHTNPEDLARQTKTADKLWGLTDTEMTAEESFIMERARMMEEQDRRGAMEAALRNLAARGQLGSGHEIGANLGAQQITSQNRMLQDLGALANASQRSMAALAQHGTLSTNMRNASDAMTSGNMDRRMGGMQGAGNLSSNMRNASDAMATGNMNRRLGGAQGAGDMANSMRSANDAISMFNTNQTNVRSSQQVGLEMDKAAGIAQTGFGVNQSIGSRASNLTNTQLGASGQQLGAQSSLTDLDVSFGNADDARKRQQVMDQLDILGKRWAGTEKDNAIKSL